MASQGPSGRGDKRGRKPPRPRSGMTAGQAEPDAQNPRRLHTEAPRRSAQHTSTPANSIAPNVSALRSHSLATDRGNRTVRAGRPKPNRNQWIKQGLGRSLAAFPTNKLEADLEPVTSANGFEVICTYNWRESKAPSIYVPGAPPSFVSKQCPVSLPQDSGVQFIDQNAYRMPNHPFVPIFQALTVMDPKFNFTGVDLVSNRNSLRKLLEFSEGRPRDSFRIDLSMIRETLFLTRHERRTKETLTKYTNPTFGHNFEKAFSQPQSGLEDSSGHHRVIKYDLGNLNCIIRYEVDACCDTPGGMLGLNEGSQDSPTPLQNGENDILASFANLSLSEKIPAAKPDEKQLIEVIQRGTSVPTTMTAEVKTRSNGLKLRYILPQLWFGRTPNLRIGMHTGGKFSRVDILNAAEKFPEWEQTHQIPLRKMARLISDLRTVVKKNGGNCVAVFNHTMRPHQLEIFVDRSKKETLPATMVEQFWREV